jgi:hypothetical protein
VYKRFPARRLEGRSLLAGCQALPVSFWWQQYIDDSECGTLAEYYLQGRTEAMRGKPVPLQLCPPNWAQLLRWETVPERDLEEGLWVSEWEVRCSRREETENRWRSNMLSASLSLSYYSQHEDERARHVNFLSQWCFSFPHEKHYPKLHLYPVLSTLPNSIAFFQDSSVCPSGKNIVFMKMRLEHWWNDINRRQWIFSAENLTWIDMLSNLCLRGERPATKPPEPWHSVCEEWRSSK